MESGMARVMDDIGEERQRQQTAKGWSAEHDDAHAVAEWSALITKYHGMAIALAERAELSAAGISVDGAPEMLLAAYRHRMVQVAALAAAAVESFDRVQASMEHAGA